MTTWIVLLAAFGGGVLAGVCRWVLARRRATGATPVADAAPVAEPRLRDYYVGFDLRPLRRANRSGVPALEDCFRPGENRVTIRILPAGPSYMYQTRSWFVVRKQHYVGSNPVRTVQCLKVPTTDSLVPSWEGQCPICDQTKALWAAANRGGNDELSSRARATKGMQRYYFNVLVRNQAGGWDGPYLYSAGVLAKDKIVSFMRDEDYGDITDLETGSDLVLLGTKRGKFMSYELMPKANPRPAGTLEQVRVWMANLWDLNVLVAAWRERANEEHAATDKSVFDCGRKCQKCQKPLSALSTDDSHFCSEQCAFRDSQYGCPQRGEARHGCPQCGEMMLDLKAGPMRYRCGYLPDGNVSHSCSQRVGVCRCRSETVAQSGCLCGTVHLQVDPEFYTTRPKSRETFRFRG